MKDHGQKGKYSRTGLALTPALFMSAKFVEKTVATGTRTILTAHDETALPRSTLIFFKMFTLLTSITTIVFPKFSQTSDLRNINCVYHNQKIGPSLRGSASSARIQTLS